MKTSPSTNNPKQKQPKGLYRLIACLTAALPWLALLIWLASHGKGLADYHLVLSDEFDYWLQASLVAGKGFFNPIAGYFGFGVSEHAAFLNFGAHGPFISIPYALGMLVFGRTEPTIMLVNLSVTSIALLLTAFISKSGKQALMLNLLLLSFAPWLMYIFSGMAEPVTFAGTLILAALGTQIWSSKANRDRYERAWFCLAVLLALFRLSNLFLLLPLMFWQLQSQKGSTWKILAKFASAALFLVLISVLLSAKYPWWFLAQLERSNEKLPFFLRHGLSCARRFAFSAEGHPVEYLFRYAYLLVTGVLGIEWIRKNITDKKASGFFLGLFALLIANLLFILFFYDFDELRGLRMLAPGLFLVVALHLTCVSSNRYLTIGKIALWIVLLIGLFTFSKSLLPELYQGHLKEKPALTSEPFIRFDPSARDRWQNTVYVDLNNYTEINLGSYEPGIGIMILRLDELEKPDSRGRLQVLKAKYLLTGSGLVPGSYQLICQINDVNLFSQ